MDRETSLLRRAMNEQWVQFRSLPFKPAFIILSATVIQIVARFHTSRAAFRQMFYPSLGQLPSYELYEHSFWMLGDFLLQFPLLLLLIRFVIKESPRSYGFETGNWRLGLKASLIFWVGMLPVLWWLSEDPAFMYLHPAPGPAKTDWGTFMIFEICTLVYLIGWEFIWRGYMIFGLEPQFGGFAVLIQMVPFALLHLGAPELETFGAVIAGIGLGMLAIATRSFWYGVLAHFLVLGTMDFFGALRVHMGELGSGFLGVLERNF